MAARLVEKLTMAGEISITEPLESHMINSQSEIDQNQSSVILSYSQPENLQKTIDDTQSQYNDQNIISFSQPINYIPNDDIFKYVCISFFNFNLKLNLSKILIKIIIMYLYD